MVCVKLAKEGKRRLCKTVAFWLKVACPVQTIRSKKWQRGGASRKEGIIILRKWNHLDAGRRLWAGDRRVGFWKNANGGGGKFTLWSPGPKEATKKRGGGDHCYGKTQGKTKIGFMVRKRKGSGSTPKRTPKMNWGLATGKHTRLKWGRCNKGDWERA